MKGYYLPERNKIAGVYAAAVLLRHRSQVGQNPKPPTPKPLNPKLLTSTSISVLGVPKFLRLVVLRPGVHFLRISRASYDRECSRILKVQGLGS